MKPEARRMQILATAKKLFSRHGFYQTQITDIAKDARIARGTIYQHFANKEDLFLTLMDEYYRKWEETIDIASDGIDLATIDPLDFFRFRIRKTLYFFSGDPELCNIALRVGLGLPGAMQAAIRRLERKINHLLIRDLELGLRNQHVRADLDVELAANLLSGALFSAAYHYLEVARHTPRQWDLDAATEQITAVFAPGIFIKPYPFAASLTGNADRRPI